MRRAHATSRWRAGGRRRIAASSLVLGLAFGFVAGTATPALAHAALDSTSPAQGSEITRAPTLVSLHFGEDVGINATSLQVTDSTGKRVDIGKPHRLHGDASTVVVDLQKGLPKGSYAVTWHVVSADSHPVAGTFSFGYGVPAGTAPAVPTGPQSVRVLHYLGRLLGFLGLAVLIGGALFVVTIWPSGATSRRTQQLLAAGWLTTALSAALLFLMEGPYGAAAGLGTVFHRATLSATLDERFGRLMLARLAILLIALVAARLLPARRHDERALLATLAAALVVTFSLAEHSGQGMQVPLAATEDALHLGAVAVWLGGLAMLLVALARQTPTIDASALAGWSRTASTAVTLIVISGGYLTWRNVGTLPALWSTSYGQLLLIKWWGLVLLLALGYLGRTWVHRWGGTANPVHTGQATVRLRASVGLEVMIGACVLAASAALINTVPGRQAYTPAYTAHVGAQNAAGNLLAVRIHLSTTKAGPITVTADVSDRSARPIRIRAISGDVEQPGQPYAPVRFTMTNAGFAQGHAKETGVVLPAPGRWQMVLQIVTTDGDDYAAATTFTIKP